MRAVHLEYRETRRYRGGWSYNDQWSEVVTATELSYSGAEYTDEEGYDYYRATAVLVVPTTGHSDKYICDAIRDTYRTDNCQHEYDCCGCLSIGVNEINRLDDGIFEVELSGSRNY